MVVALGADASIVLIAVRDSGASESSPQKPTDQEDVKSPAPSEPSDEASDEPSVASVAAPATACAATVEAATAVVEAARIGISHVESTWRLTKPGSGGDISDDAKNATYKATRLAGPADLSRYEKAPAPIATLSPMTVQVARAATMAAPNGGLYPVPRPRLLWWGVDRGNDA